VDSEPSGEQLVWTDLAGTGTIWSCTVYHRAMSPAFRDQVPYAVAMVELDEAIRMVGALTTHDDVMLVRRGPCRPVGPRHAGPGGLEVAVHLDQCRVAERMGLDEVPVDVLGARETVTGHALVGEIDRVDLVRGPRPVVPAAWRLSVPGHVG
jgi:hypothetical protein